MLWNLLWLVHVALAILAISDVVSSGRDMGTKVVLIVLILAIPFIGPGLYLFALKDKGYKI
jgi:hypothetical protein